MKIKEIKKIIEILPLTFGGELEIQTAKWRIRIVKSPTPFNPSRVRIIQSLQVGRFQKKVYRNEKIKKGQVIGLLSSLRVKEKIYSPVDGTVKFCSKSGGVEYNELLFEIVKD